MTEFEVTGLDGERIVLTTNRPVPYVTPPKQIPVSFIPASPGDLIVSSTPDGLRIDQADPIILIADEFLAEMREGKMPEVAVLGDVVTFTGMNRTVVYRLTGARDGWGSHYAESLD